MTRMFFLLTALVLLAAAGAGAATGETADTAAVAVAAEAQEKPVDSSIAPEPPFFSWAYWQEGGTKGTSRSEVFRNFGLFFVAVIALGFGIWRAVTAYMQARASQRQAHTAEQGHITERFSRAVEQLGHDRVAVRIGGLYALKRIAEDSVERDHLVVMDVITNFIRQPPYAVEQRKAAEWENVLRAAASDQNDGAAVPPPEPELIDCPDIVAAIEIIQGRSEAQRAVEGKDQLSLSRASLSYLRLPEVDIHIFALAGANLTGTDLTDAILLDANLVGAKLLYGNLTGAMLLKADLTNANLSDANLSGANLRAANLMDADLSSAILTDADLTQANLMGANLMDANLSGTDLIFADLSGADLTGAKLPGANLSGANLKDANLSDADLKFAHNLTRDQLNSACVGKGGTPPTLPDYLNQKERWRRCPEATAE